MTQYRYRKIYVYGIPYSSPGEYTYSKENNYAPVYTKGSYSIYQRDDGKWYLDFNGISEEYGGSISSSDESNVEFLWETDWKDDDGVYW